MLTIKPITLKDANKFVKQYHRHNLPTVGCKFAIACYKDDRICGVAICGRPTARNADDGEQLRFTATAPTALITLAVNCMELV